MIALDYFSDLLCIWAYLAQVKLDTVRRSFPEQVEIRSRFVPVFASVPDKIGSGWADRGGYEGYAEHVRAVAARFDHAEVHDDLWVKVAPPSCLGIHAWLKAAELIEGEGGFPTDRLSDYELRTPLEELAWRLRVAFFRDLRNIARCDVQDEIAAGLELPVGDIRRRLDDGTAFAALAEDHQFAEKTQVSGSPTFVINEGRQKLYGNVGYRVIEANIQELLRDDRDKASWC